MMNRISILLLVGCICSALSGCGVLFKSDDSVFRNRSKDYLRSGPIRVIEIPEEMNAIALEPLYPIPDVNATDEFGDAYNLLEFDIPRPDAINSDEQSLGVKIQKLGEERWIYLSASTSQVWPRAQSYLARTDVGVMVRNAETGLIETEWLKFSDDEAIMTRFRIRLEKGIHPDTSEVHVLQMQVPMGTDVSTVTDWPEISTDPAREEWLMRELANHLAETIDNASASLLGQNVGGDIKASYVRGAGEPTLKLSLSAERAWATLTHAAKKEGFVTWGLNQEKGVIFAGYSKYEVKKKGFFKRLFTLSNDGTLPEKARYPLSDVLLHLSDSNESRAVFDAIDGVGYNGELSKLNKGYLIIMRQVTDDAEVIIRDSRGRKLAPTKAKEFIRLLRKNLI